ncbi:cysteine proteinase [Myriangium duriaei CBS 260.36]|uniref:ubiquitinyl hydrolase 1 n=1 Tax=Myriangium duriaei CBS 260.36 TaxID=1168546 RepID=A0A9P4J0Y4_9PEZI|nr:cysteine proteinase [Myriangium duriaei CBS 260.36]
MDRLPDSLTALQIGGEMLVDSDYDEKQQDAVAVISTPDDSMDEPEQEPLANDFEAMRDRFLINPADLEVEAEAIHTWDIERWRQLPKRTHGPIFHAGGHPWRILFFPAGNNASESVSFYLEQGFDQEPPPENWYACVQFMLVLWNEKDPSIYLHHEANHRFTAEEGDWGFTRFADKNRIFATKFDDKDRPFIENDSAKMTAYVRIMKDPTGVLWHNFNNYDSKKETGMVGLRNQGATCYLNSLLQSLYFTNAFRRAIYQIPTEQETDARNSSAWSLQRLFYRLQTDPTAVSTAELTQSFGWESRQIFEQQDVQELSRILMEKMEEKMKGTEAEKALPHMFVGKMKTYLKCINVDYESSRIEDFWDLQMNVSGCKTLDDSFKNYVEVETLEGDNKYQAEGYGLQDAKKGVIFESFPQVLHLQLKRFEYDFQRDMMVKVNDRYEFPDVFDASPYLSDTADKSEPYIYHLHGVLVHSGDMNAGHYYAFIKPTKDGDFYKFDDDRVTRATKREALDENFGGDYGPSPNGVGGGLKMQNPFSRTWSTKRSMSAYMLVYIRESRLDQILSDPEQIKPPEHLPTRLTEEKAAIEKRRKEREEAHLYMNVQVCTDDNFRKWQGFDLVHWEAQDEEDPATPRTMRVLRAMTAEDFVKHYAEQTGEEASLLRPWVVVNRQNGTKRPDQFITQMSMTLEEAALKHGTRQALFKIWMEKKAPGSNGIHSDQDAPAKDAIAEKKPIIIFLKYFDVEAQELKGVGHTYMSPNDRVQDLAGPILKLMGWAAGSTDLKLFEEIKPNFVETMKPKQTLSQSELQDGDIVCFQKALSPEDVQAIQQKSPSAYLEAPAFYDYLLNRIVVHFAPKPAAIQNVTIDSADDAKFSLYLSRKDSYDNLAIKVAEHLSKVSKSTIDPTHVRFTTVNVQSQKPRTVVKRLPNATLTSILIGTSSGGYTGYGYANQSADSLYYEVLEMSLTDLEQRKLVKITWLSEGITKEEQHDILVPKQGTMADVLPILQKKAAIPPESLENIRFLEAHSGKIYRVLDSNFPVANINDFCSIYAEVTPPDEVAIPEDAADRLTCCFHYEKDPSKTHNIPFVFLVKDGEVFKETKERLSKRTGIKGKAFEKIKFAVIRGGQSYARPVYVDDEDILSEKLASDDHFGLEHANKTRNIWAQHERLNIR